MKNADKRRIMILIFFFLNNLGNNVGKAGIFDSCIEGGINSPVVRIKEIVK